MRPATCLPIAILFLAAALPARGQDISPLLPGTPIERSIAPGERHSYSVDLAARMYIVGHVNQVTTDVVVEILAPGGESIGTFDDPARGPEMFSFSSAEAGAYRIEVTPFNDNEPGRYVALIRSIEPVATTQEGRVNQLFARWKGTETPGAAVAISRGGDIVYQGGFGSAQLEYGIPITPETIFHVASVSKQVTAFAVTMLAERGSLSLDDDIRDYLPEIPDFGETITIRHLIHHTSGLRDQWNLLAMAGWRLDDVITRDQVLRMMSRQRELNFSPGEEMLYCNTGYTLLGEIVARVSGESFAEWTAHNIFSPLGMNATHFHDDHQMIVPNRAYSYAQGATGLQKSVLSYANAGATSLFTTAPDMTRWLRNLESGTVGGADVVAQVHERAVLNSGDSLGYASGLSIGAYRGLRTVGHGGADAGFRSHVLQFPEKGLDIVVLSNLASGNPGGLARQIADIYLDGQFVEGGVVEAPSAPAEAPSEETPEPNLAEYVGRYYSPELETAYAFEVDNGHLVTKHQRHDDMPLSPTGPDGFATNFWFFRDIRFERDAAGAINGMRVSSGRVRNLRFDRVGY